MYVVSLIFDISDGRMRSNYEDIGGRCLTATRRAESSIPRQLRPTSLSGNTPREERKTTWQGRTMPQQLPSAATLPPECNHAAQLTEAKHGSDGPRVPGLGPLKPAIYELVLQAADF
jgi:hypothetical protein